MPAAGVAAASGGNHGAAVAYAAMRLGHKARIFVPEISSPAKIARIRGYGAELTVGGKVYAEALAACEAYIADTGALSVHAFDQVETMLGQGSVGLELERQALGIDTLLVAVGGGGLIGGIAAWYEAASRSWASSRGWRRRSAWPLLRDIPSTRRPAALPRDSLAPKRIGELVFPIVQPPRGDAPCWSRTRRSLDAQRALWETARIAAEPGAAAPLAALLSGAYVPSQDERVGILVSGGNTTAVAFDRLLSPHCFSGRGSRSSDDACSGVLAQPCAPDNTALLSHRRSAGEGNRPYAAFTLRAASEPALDLLDVRRIAVAQHALPILRRGEGENIGAQLVGVGRGDGVARAIAGAHQQLRVRASEARHRADEPRLVLPVGDGLGRDVTGVHQHRQCRGLGPHQVPDGPDAVRSQALGRLGADRGPVDDIAVERRDSSAARLPLTVAGRVCRLGARAAAAAVTRSSRSSQAGSSGGRLRSPRRCRLCLHRLPAAARRAGPRHFEPLALARGALAGRRA